MTRTRLLGRLKWAAGACAVSGWLAGCEVGGVECAPAVVQPCLCPDGSASTVLCLDRRVIGCACEGGSDAEWGGDPDVDAPGEDVPVEDLGDRDGREDPQVELDAFGAGDGDTDLDPTPDGSAGTDAAEGGEDLPLGDAADVPEDGATDAASDLVLDVDDADPGATDAPDLDPGETGDTADASVPGDADSSETGEADADPGLLFPTCAELEVAPRPFLGCVFWAVDLPAYPDPFGGLIGPGALYLTNPSPNVVAVRVTDFAPGASGSATTVLAAYSSTTVPLPNRTLATGVRAAAGVQVAADGPILVSQSSPAAIAGGGDISIARLRPLSATMDRYRAVSTPGGTQMASFPSQRAFIVVIATESPTRVVVTPSTTLDAGVDVASWGPGDVHALDLAQGDVLLLTATSTASESRDLSGTLIASSAPVIVLSGHEQTTVGETETGPACCADRIEEQLPPVQSWGTSYIALRSAGRSLGDDTWIVAADEASTIRTTPAIAGLDGVSMEAGEVIRAIAHTSFELVASAPVLVARVTASRDVAGSVGDPALVVLDGADQRSTVSYADVPATSAGSRWLTVATPEGGALYVSGRLVTGTPARVGGFDVWTLPAGAGLIPVVAELGAQGVVSCLEPAGGADTSLGGL